MSGQTRADAPAMVWATDFQFGALPTGARSRSGPIIDEHARERLGGKVERNITGDELTGNPTASGAYSVALRFTVQEFSCEWVGTTS